MKSFENFIESDAFFPILIVLLIILILVFVWVLLSSKKEAQKRKLRKANVTVDESAEIKIIEDSNAPKVTTERKVEQEEVETNEVKIIEETTENLEEKLYNTTTVDLSELPLVDIPIPQTNDESFEIPIIEEKEDEGIEFEIPRTESIIEDNVPQSENVDIELTRPLTASEDIGEKFEIPPMKQLETENGEVAVVIPESVIINKEENNIVDAFSSIPNETREINQTIEIEAPKEYIGEKTEIFEFPDFDEKEISNVKNNDEDIEAEIIKAANKYVESIMNKN